jgi:UDP-N-acetylglucosamine 2-epimerase (non-hydrolysing)
MIDTLHRHLDRIEGRDILGRLGLDPKNYALVTLHRPSNVDDPETLGAIGRALAEIQERIRLVFPIHPRTGARLAEFDLWKPSGGILRIDPLGYLDFMKLMKESAFVMTDSGGVQEETTALGIPCLTLRWNTERPITLTQGTNRLVGTQVGRIVHEAGRILDGDVPEVRTPDLWDGAASKRIVSILMENCTQIRELYGDVRRRTRCREIPTHA